MTATLKNTRIRSFIRRNSRLTEAQLRAYSDFWPNYGLNMADGLLKYPDIFKNDHPCYLEIGFGMGTSLVHIAKLEPTKNFIGIDIHRPGIGSVFNCLQEQGIENLKIFEADAIDVLTQCIADNSLQGIQIFFPDPWPKRKHHPRRLIQTEFLNLIAQKLSVQGSLHLATDWDHYAAHMLKVLQAHPAFANMATDKKFHTRSPYRPIQSKFELRAIAEGRKVWELAFLKC